MDGRGEQAACQRNYFQHERLMRATSAKSIGAIDYLAIPPVGGLFGLIPPGGLGSFFIKHEQVSFPSLTVQVSIIPSHSFSMFLQSK